MNAGLRCGVPQGTPHAYRKIPPAKAGGASHLVRFRADEAAINCLLSRSARTHFFATAALDILLAGSAGTRSTEFLVQGLLCHREMGGKKIG